MAEVLPFPILDCSSIVADSARTDDEALQDFGKQFVSALSSNRACYLKHHGIGNDLKEKFMDTHRIFFTQPVNVKEAFERKQDTLFGWVDKENDLIDNSGKRNEVEAFCYMPSDDNGNWPNANIELYNKKQFAASTSLAERLCEALSLGLGLEKNFFWNAHKLGITGTSGGIVNTRTNYYPPCSSDSEPAYTRFAEHTDYGTITLVFLDDEVEGLEVEIRDKGFVPVPPIPDTIVILAGDQLQRWTSDTIQSTYHRVVWPAKESHRQMSRLSTVLFVYPDKDFEIKPVDGSTKYEPVTGMGFILEQSRQLSFKY